MFAIKGKKLALVLFGSPKKNGFTYKALSEFMSKHNDYEFVIIDAYEEKILPCIDCKYCVKENACIYNDFEKIDNLLNTADMLVVASPIYNLSFPAPLKAIIDRMQLYYSSKFFRNIKNPIEKNKDGVIILTCGENSEDGFNIIKQQLKKTFALTNTKLVDQILIKDTDNKSINDI